MAGKPFVLSGGTPVTVFKHRSSRSLRITVSRGKARVTIPSWTPYAAGRTFAQSREEWIRAQLQPQKTLLVHEQQIGKTYHLSFVPSVRREQPTSRILADKIQIKYPANTQIDAPEVQQVAQEACVRALRMEAEALLPKRLQQLADKHGFTYGSVSIKRLTGRWGSCDQDQNIVFNLFLMTVPWELIDYVILHELTHTRILRHGADFWDAMDRVLPQSRSYRTRLRAFQPDPH